MHLVALYFITTLLCAITCYYYAISRLRRTNIVTVSITLHYITSHTHCCYAFIYEYCAASMLSTRAYAILYYSYTRFFLPYYVCCYWLEGFITYAGFSLLFAIIIITHTSLSATVTRY